MQAVPEGLKTDLDQLAGLYIIADKAKPHRIRCNIYVVTTYKSFSRIRILIQAKS